MNIECGKIAPQKNLYEEKFFFPRARGGRRKAKNTYNIYKISPLLLPKSILRVSCMFIYARIFFIFPGLVSFPRRDSVAWIRYDLEKMWLYAIVFFCVGGKTLRFYKNAEKIRLRKKNFELYATVFLYDFFRVSNFVHNDFHY